MSLKAPKAAAPRTHAREDPNPALRPSEPELPPLVLAGIVDALTSAIVLEFRNESTRVVESPRRHDHDEEQAA